MPNSKSVDKFASLDTPGDPGAVKRRGIVPYFFVTVIVIVTVIMISAMFIFYTMKTEYLKP